LEDIVVRYHSDEEATKGEIDECSLQPSSQEKEAIKHNEAPTTRLQ